MYKEWLKTTYMEETSATSASATANGYGYSNTTTTACKNYYWELPEISAPVNFVDDRVKTFLDTYNKCIETKSFKKEKENREMEKANKKQEVKKQEQEVKRPKYRIEDITILQPNKVMRVKVSTEGNKIKDIICVVSEPDAFDMTRGCFIALAKYVYGDKYTVEGIEHRATEFSYQKDYIKEVRRAIKAYDRKIKAENEAKKKAEEERKLAAARKAKKAAKRDAKATRRKFELAEAILLARQLEEQDNMFKKDVEKAVEKALSSEDKPLAAKHVDAKVVRDPKALNFTVTVE